MAPTDSPPPASKARSPLKLKKGSLVKVDRHGYMADSSRAASDPEPPDYTDLNKVYAFAETDGCNEP
ncbi:MAG: hypothetical protein OXG70_06310, partial [Cyanobacteria bacterium MAG IRC1_bin_28]|nr:hypothetical protein [Cyanobacteria bacterium MAG IRC1_bin_28]